MSQNKINSVTYFCSVNLIIHKFLIDIKAQNSNIKLKQIFSNWCVTYIIQQYFKNYLGKKLNTNIGSKIKLRKSTKLLEYCSK